MAKAYDCSDETFQQIIINSNSFSECCRKLGYSDKGRHGADMIKKRCEELNISYSHFNTAGHVNTKRYELDDILVENSTYQNISRLKTRLISENRLEYKCALCGNDGHWNGSELTLELDHINGNHLDHRIENLRFLCPNCHSQTNTYSGRNKTIPC